MTYVVIALTVVVIVAWRAWKQRAVFESLRILLGILAATLCASTAVTLLRQ
jgi:hypothetical protein